MSKVKASEVIISDCHRKELEVSAKKALENAYAPYSQFYVGAAVLTSRGGIYSGCNVENASSGGGVCAERVAIWKAVSQGDREMRAIFIITRKGSTVPPCGFCRQILNEFVSEDCLVVMSNADGEFKESRLRTLLPESFGPEFLGLSGGILES